MEAGVRLLKPLASLPYLILRVHVCSLSYQQLSSGSVSLPTCQHQRRHVALNQTQCERQPTYPVLFSVSPALLRFPRPSLRPTQ
jgi:hypothetical protein